MCGRVRMNWGSENIYHVPRKLGAERYSLPALSSIRGVQQNSGLADDPAFFALEAYRVEPVVEIFVLSGRDGAREPGVATVFGLQYGLPCAKEET